VEAYAKKSKELGLALHHMSNDPQTPAIILTVAPTAFNPARFF
jgi:hypothetical protein